jgi:hypothetical protein
VNNFKQVSGILAQRAEDVARYLLPQGKKVGNEWEVGSISGEQGYRRGVWQYCVHSRRYWWWSFEHTQLRIEHEFSQYPCITWANFAELARLHTKKPAFMRLFYEM